MKKWLHDLDGSAVFTLLGIIFLFSSAVVVTLLAPPYLDKSWVEPTSAYQVQMYTVSDPYLYIGADRKEGDELQGVYHLKQGFSLLAFKESETVQIDAPKELEPYVTREGDEVLKLTSRLLLLKRNNKGRYELYAPETQEAFAPAQTNRIVEEWVDQDFTLIDPPIAPYHKDAGVIYIKNPTEYKVLFTRFGGKKFWISDPEKGEPIQNLEQLKGKELGFRSRKELIERGEQIYKAEGCWYCHTDQTRTLIQDVVLNGTESYPAPPSSANEYIFQKVTFAGTRRIGPDISRVGIKRPDRDWHRSHFWAPKLKSKGSIMPSFRHFFDFDPSGTGLKDSNIPSEKFEAVYQYLMTKGTRITAPTEAWWRGLDPLQTKEIIEGNR